MLQLTQILIDGIRLVRPTQEEIGLLAPGDFAPDCFGRMRRVTRISSRGTTISGKAFVSFFTEFGDNPATQVSECSHSMVEGEIVPTLAATNRWQRGTLIPWGQMDRDAAKSAANQIIPLLPEWDLAWIADNGLPVIGPLRDLVEAEGAKWVEKGEVIDADLIADFIAASDVAKEADRMLNL